MRPNPYTILLVDDSPDDILFMTRAFKKIGVTDPIQHVGGGDEAVRYLKGEGAFSDRATYQYPSFIVTDLKMPQGDGFALLHHLKGSPTHAVIPTVVYSSSDDPDDIRRCYAMGAGSYIVKRNKTDELQRMFKIFFDYWMECEVPAVDSSGRILPTYPYGKLGERFSVRPMGEP